MGFIGFEEDFNEYKKEEKIQNVVGTSNKIAYDDMPEISNEDLKLLMESRYRHDPFIVYMQSDVNFYDEFYNGSESVIEGIDKDLMEDVKNIRRIYKNYFQYDHALRLIDIYLDALEEKYGGPDMFQTYLQAGLVKDWIPPRPVYSRTSPDYQYYLEGKFELNINDWDDDKIESLMAELTESLRAEIPIEDIGIVGDVMTDSVISNQYMLASQQSTNGVYRMGMNTNFNGVSANDLIEVQRMLRSWMDPETEVKSKDNKVSSDAFFTDTEDAIRARYFTQSPITATGLSEAMEKGYMEEDDEDLDEMVIDPVSGRPMTRGELRNRQFIRLLAESGWNELRLMRKLGVGSNFELKLLEQKRRRRKNATKKAKSFMDDIAGYDITEVTDIEELNNILFED